MLAGESIEEAREPGIGWPGLAADIVHREASAAGSLPARVAIASYEFNGIVRNGGIGTACTSLAKALAAEGHDVDIFFTGWADDSTSEAFARWESEYARQGIKLHWFDYGALAYEYDAPVYSAAHSYALYQQLRRCDAEQPYDAIHFVESVGHGFYALQAKRLGLAFGAATTVVGVHSPRRWMSEAHGQPFDHPAYLGDEFLERRSIELADVVVSPSAHMLDWLASKAVRLPERSYVQQYVTDFDLASTGRREPEESAAPVEELVFFGRLEPRKGLPAFCDALDLLVERHRGRLRRVTFLGRHSPALGQPAEEYLAIRAEGWPWEWRVVSDLDRDDALAYLSAPGRLAVMASPIDNSPNTVYEAIGLGIPFVASTGGGIAELVHPDDRDAVTFDPWDRRQVEIDPGDPRGVRPRPSGEELADRLEQALKKPLRTARFAVDPAANRETHLEWHRALVRGRGIAMDASAAESPVNGHSNADNGGPPVRVVQLPACRELNGAAATDLLLLVDPGVEREPRLASQLIAAERAAGAGGLVTSLGTVDVIAPDGTVTTRGYLPTGGPSVFGLVANCFGAGAVAARREVLDGLGVFDDEAMGTEIRVAEVLARAAASGMRIDVVPEPLYRVSIEASNPYAALSAWTDPLSVMRPYHRALGSEAAVFADVAAELARQRIQQDGRAAFAEQQLAEANRRLEVITGSRSWRLTGRLRRIGARLRGRGH